MSDKAKTFLSGRIPVVLFEAIEKRAAETNRTKTDILIDALNGYLSLKPSNNAHDQEWQGASLVAEVSGLGELVQQLSSRLTEQAVAIEVLKQKVESINSSQGKGLGVASDRIDQLDILV
ncbi:MAG: hypothetical protein WBB28_01335 [Crinalium sp.]